MIRWEERLIPYERAVNELAVKFNCLANEFNVLGKHSPIQSVEYRVKKVSSIMDKMRRKSFSLEEFEEKLEDVAGIRIICRFVEDIEEVVKLIKMRDGLDLEVLKERDYVSFMKVSGYRSYHIIINYPVITALERKDVTCEIQIRTMAMNFWAVTEHSLRYKYEKRIPEDIHKRLISSADAAFILDKKISEIRLDILASEDLYKSKEKIVDEILKNIQTLTKTADVEEVDKINEKFKVLHEEGKLQELLEFARAISNMTDLYRAK